MISIDTETSGLDIRHGARPFLVTVCRDDGKQLLWEFDVDPFTRAVTYPPDDVQEIREVIASADEICAHGIKFDAKMLVAADILDRFPWERGRCTLVASHLLASSMPHDLTSLVLHYLGEDIQPHEEELKVAVTAARRLVTSKAFTGGDSDEDADLFGDVSSGRWHIARKGDPTMPSADSDAWHFDYWLPRAVAKHLRYASDHPWWTVCSRYANYDSASTLPLWLRMRREVDERGLRAIYDASMELPEVIADMETRGVSYDLTVGSQLIAEYRSESQKAAGRCAAVAREIGYDLQLPKGAVNKSLSRFAFGYDECKCVTCGLEFVDDQAPGHKCKTKKCGSTSVTVTRRQALDLPRVAFTDSGSPSLNKEAFTQWRAILERGTPQFRFIDSLSEKRGKDTASTYLEGYERYAVPTTVNGFAVLYPNLNQCGTAHLRMSSDSPNSQNVSKQLRTCQRCSGTGEIDGDECQSCRGEGEVNYNIRRPFRPAPGREFWALDYENIELMIPAYRAEERLMIELFEKPDDPPFYGSQHLLNASIAYPDVFWPLADKRGEFKKRYASTWYQWIKNFDFALAYSCGEATGDRAAHKRGVFRAVKEKLAGLTRYSDSMIAFARKHGYVETVPDKTVNPRRGYPIMCGRSAYGDISPTIPLNYHVSGSAMWATRKAMVRTHRRLGEMTAADPRGYYIALQIHDEILFDFPVGGRRNLSRIMEIKDLMEDSGRDMSIPLRVSVSWHPHDWATSEELA